MDQSLSQEGVVHVLWLSVQFLMDRQPNPSVKFVPAFGLHGTRRKRRAPYLKRWASR
jgi:hypothetical protein